MESLLRTRNLTKRFHQVVAIDSVSFDVQPGEIHCLLGENGAGKSTLAECIYGFYRPEQGEIYIEGEPVQISSPAEAIGRGIGMVHQHFVLVPTLSVLENIVNALPERSNLTIAQHRELAKRLLTEAGLEMLTDKLDMQVVRLPVGQQRLLAIIGQSVAGPRLLCVDEPTTNVNEEDCERLLAYLRKESERRAVMVILHNQKQGC